MTSQITSFVKDLDTVTAMLEASDQLLAAQVDANEDGDEEQRDHFCSSTNLMLDRAIHNLTEILTSLVVYRRNER